jgi:hypothetical protein
VSQETPRNIYRHDPPARADAFRQVERGETRSASYIENAMASAEPGALPNRSSLRQPKLMLQTQPFKLGGVGAKHIFFFFASHAALSSKARVLDVNPLLAKRGLMSKPSGQHFVDAGSVKGIGFDRVKRINQE